MNLIKVVTYAFLTHICVLIFGVNTQMCIQESQVF